MSSSHFAETTNDPADAAPLASDAPAGPLDRPETSVEQRTNRVKSWLLPCMVVTSQLVIVLVNTDGGGNVLSDSGELGLFWGTQCGIAFIAGLSTVFGPLAFWVRSVLAICAILLSVASLALNISRTTRSLRIEDVGFVSACMLVIWILCQLFWLVRLPSAIRLCRPSDAVGTIEVPQFSIRSLLGLMFASACVLTVAKYSMSVVDLSETIESIAEFAFLAIAALLVNLPVYLSCLWPSTRYPFALMAACLLIALISVIESSLFDLLNSGEAPFGLLLAINFVQAAWVIAFSLLLRSYGYRLRMGGKAMVGATS